MNYDHHNLDVRYDSDNDVKKLFQSAKERKERAMFYHLLGEACNGKTIDVTKSPKLYEALNRDKMEFEEILKLNPEQVKETIDYVKQRKVEQNGVWWNSKSDAKWGEKGAIPPCVYFSRPKEYWNNKALTNNFFNTFSKFRIAENPL